MLHEKRAWNALYNREEHSEKAVSTTMVRKRVIRRSSDAIRVGAICFHGGRPHYDELKTVCILVILGRITLSMNNVRIIVNPFKYINSPDLARQHFEHGDPALGGKCVIFPGWTPGGGDWNPLDEHENVSRARREASAAGKVIADMGEEEVRERLDHYLDGCGLKPTWRKRATDWFLREVAIDSWKDHSSTARDLGPSRLHKIHLFASVFPIGEDGTMTERSYSEKQIREALQNTWQIMLNTLCMYNELEPGVEKDVERLVVRALSDRYHGRWKPERHVATIRALISHLRKVRDEMCASIAKGTQEALLKAKKQENVRRKFSAFKKELESLALHFANMQNRAEYTSDAWFIQGWLLAHGVSCPVPVHAGTTVESLLAELKEHKKAPEALVSMLTSYTTDPKAIRKLQGLRIRRHEQEPWMDEEHWSCPLALHHQISRMLGRESMRTTDEGAGLRASKGSAFRFTKRAVDTYLAGHVLKEHARRELSRKTVTRLPVLMTAEDGAEPVTSQMLHAETLNPSLTGAVRGRHDVCVITWEPIHSAYVSIDHVALGHAHANDLYRRIAVVLRALEYRARGIDLPDDWWELATAGRLADDTWYLHALPKERNMTNSDGDTYEAAVNLVVRSIFHRNGRGTRLSALVIRQAVQIVWTLHHIPQRLIRHKGRRKRFKMATVDTLMADWLYVALRGTADLDDAIRVIEQKAAELPTFAVLAR